MNYSYWLVVWNRGNLWLSIDWECHHPNWRTHIFQRGWNYQPVMHIMVVVGGAEHIYIYICHKICWFHDFLELSIGYHGVFIMGINGKYNHDDFALFIYIYTLFFLKGILWKLIWDIWYIESMEWETQPTSPSSPAIIFCYLLLLNLLVT